MAGEAPVRVPALLAGTRVDDGAAIDRRGPYARRTVSRARDTGPDDVRIAVDYAVGAAKEVTRLAPATRADVLDRAAGIARDRRDDIARLLALELGKPVKDGAGELDRVAETFAVCAAEARRIDGEVLPVAGWARGIGTTALTYRAPVGVALAITPFNAPANLLAHKLGASFAAGNTTIVKAPPQAPASSAAVVGLLPGRRRARRPRCSCCTAAARSARRCARRPEIGVVSFTGSAADRRRRGPGRRPEAARAGAGRERRDDRVRGRRHRRRGHGLRPDRVQQLRAELHLGAAGVRAPVPVRGVSRRVRGRDVDGLIVGDPLDPGHRRRIHGGRRGRRAGGVVGGLQAAAGGAAIVRGGTRDGAVVAPTIVADPPVDASVVTHEVFGALVSVLPYDDFAAVLSGCNGSRFGLQAGLFTRDVDRIVTAWRELEVGGLVVNGSSNFRLDHVPFGGVKDSGFGRESPRWMIEDYTTVKTLLLRGVSVWGEH